MQRQYPPRSPRGQQQQSRMKAVSMIIGLVIVGGLSVYSVYVGLDSGPFWYVIAGFLMLVFSILGIRSWSRDL